MPTAYACSTRPIEKVYVRFEGSDGLDFRRILKSRSRPSPLPFSTQRLRDNEIHFPFKTDKQDFIDAVKTRGRDAGRRRSRAPHHLGLPLGEHCHPDGQEAGMGPREGTIHE